jgi:phosphate starvation-inducible PhoH-like protein
MRKYRAKRQQRRAVQNRKPQPQPQPYEPPPNKPNPQTHGYKDVRLEAKSANQRTLIRSIRTNDVTIAVGPPGCGKTHIAAAMAVQMMRNDEIDKIYICRPSVVAGKDIGFLPGEIDDKMGPFMVPLFDEFSVYCHPNLIKLWVENKQLETVPLNFMRGRTFKDCVLILDEAQNATRQEIKMLLTRFGVGATVIITGDLNQSDLPRNIRGGLRTTIQKLEGIEGIQTVHLEAIDVVRHHLTAIIEERLHESEDE